MVHLHHATVVSPFIQFERFSKFERLIRALAYVYLFGDRSRRRKDSKELTREYLQLAEARIYQAVQEESYPDEVVTLKKKQTPDRNPRIDKTSILYQLSPFLDGLGVIRMESRMNNALCVPYETRYPMILPRYHRVTCLMIDYYHRRYGHGSNESVLNEIRQKYHVSRHREALRQISKNCVWCRVYKSRPKTPKMYPLPSARLSPHVRAFTFVGLDYCGPFLIKVNRSSVKRWIALFCCLTVRGVHLEVVHTLTTESCKLAIRRFISCRGSPQEIYSDQGTNFVGARRELAESLRNVNQELSETFTNTRTKWHLNPPAAPHMGGAWERLVRTVKAALAALKLPNKPNEETFATFVAEAASMVNSRPLTYVPLEDDCQESLTPNHFILLSSSGVVQPTKTPTNERDTLRNNWKQIQSLLDQFWSRWIRECLPVIALRGKWIEDVEPIKMGDLVVIVEETVRNSWTRGRVERVYQGKDGRIRKADVLTNNGVFQRPVTKLAVLDLADRGIAGS
ncbi:uncharacterized protein LOC129761428 [Toxorhynchites rutilus septentrionalis]|uniref:uncharacterized protein LOC129761428 n=1 Tax=Toxorhynchites rutilus septentrionalis TaxID=329112 RepID=UPI00247A4076|nr:uncharacterized protein LOC129761428 [Toxorhynchites rutilus septentrionalis]